MKAFIYGIFIQWKIDLRNKGIFLTYYAVPLIFFAFMGGIFTSINPEAYKTLIQSMTIFGVTMGAVLGAPVPLCEVFGSDIKKSYIVGNVPIYIPIINNLISGFIHLFIMSLVIYFIGPIAFNAVVPTSPYYFLGLSLFILASLSIGTLLGMIVKDVSKLTLIGQLVFLPSIMLSGIMFPSSMLPSFLESIGKLFPATIGYNLMIVDNQLSNNIILLIIFSIICILLSIYRAYKAKIG